MKLKIQTLNFNKLLKKSNFNNNMCKVKFTNIFYFNNVKQKSNLNSHNINDISTNKINNVYISEKNINNMFNLDIKKNFIEYKTVLKYNNLEFKITKPREYLNEEEEDSNVINTEENKLLVGNFLHSFSRDIAKNVAISENTYKILKDDEIEEHKDINNNIYKQCSNNKYNGKNLQIFNRRNNEYLKNNDNIYRYSKLDIVDYDISKYSLKQRYLNFSLKSCFSSAFQEQLNKLVNSYTDIKTLVPTEKIYDNYISKTASSETSFTDIYLSKFISQNSHKIKCEKVSCIDLNNLGIPDIKNVLFAKKVNANSIRDILIDSSLYTAIPINICSNSKESFEEGLLNTFSILKKMCKITNKSKYLGINTNLSKWVFCIFNNDLSNKVETKDYFKISDHYSFSIFNGSPDKIDKHFSYIMDIIENIIYSENSDMFEL